MWQRLQVAEDTRICHVFSNGARWCYDMEFVAGNEPSNDDVESVASNGPSRQYCCRIYILQTNGDRTEISRGSLPKFCDDHAFVQYGDGFWEIYDNLGNMTTLHLPDSMFIEMGYFLVPRESRTSAVTDDNFYYRHWTSPEPVDFPQKHRRLFLHKDTILTTTRSDTGIDSDLPDYIHAFGSAPETGIDISRQRYSYHVCDGQIIGLSFQEYHVNKPTEVSIIVFSINEDKSLKLINQISSTIPYDTFRDIPVFIGADANGYYVTDRRTIWLMLPKQ